MKTLYLDFGMGVAGDMLTGALLDLIDDKDAVLEEFRRLGFEGVEFSYSSVEKCGITGTKATIKICGVEEGAHDHDHDHDHHHDHDHDHHHDHDHDHDHDHHDHHHDHDHDHDHHHDHDHDHHHDHDHDHHHHTVKDIEKIITENTKLSSKVKRDILGVFSTIAEAESQVHGMPIEQVHFHEVGTMDAIADVTLACMLIDRIGADRIVASPINTGSGQVKCAHGILPVPAPATALILKGVPSYSNGIMSELCTPTGAAIAKHFADTYGPMPIMITERIGYGMGNKDFEVCNAVRATIGEEASQFKHMAEPNGYVCELSCNIDDMTGEEIGFAFSKIMEAGALDVYQTPVYMKKCRPGIKLSVLCKEKYRDEIVRAIFKHTTTIGIRESVMNRYELKRDSFELESDLGTVRIKESAGYGIEKSKPEFEDLKDIAIANDMSIGQVKREF